MRKILFILVLLGLSLILTACGDGKETTTINVQILDVQFSPNEFTVPAGAEVAFTAHNYGLNEHNFIIFKKGFDAGGYFDHEDEVNVYWMVKVVLPGQTVTETFTAPTEPGEYSVACGFGEHLEMGQVGKLIVVE